MSVRRARAAAIAAALAVFGSAPAFAEGGFVTGLLERAEARLRVAPRTPPEPVSVTWQTRHVGSVRLGGPLLDLAAADLTGDGRDEILALAAGEAVAIARKPGALEVLASVSFDELALAPVRPRDPVGSSAVAPSSEGVQWWARSSDRAEAAVIAWRDGSLVLDRSGPGFPVCAGSALELEDGRNVFAGWPRREEPLHGARCRRDLVGPDGRPLDVYASVSVGGELEVASEPRCAPGAECAEATAARASGRGYAIAIGDVDRDGFPEIATSAHRPAGEPDAVRVATLRGGDLVQVYRTELAGPVAAIAIGDTSGDGRVELLVAVRAPGRARVEIYTLLS